jgi:hypothetical protein
MFVTGLQRPFATLSANSRHAGGNVGPGSSEAATSRSFFPPRPSAADVLRSDESIALLT